MGFPNRVIRSTLGPTLEDTAPVKDAKKAIGAPSFNLAWWQLTGINMACPIGLLVLQRNGSVYETVKQGFAFDPHGVMPLVTWTRSAAGIYTYALASPTYPDENGNAVTVTLNGALPEPQFLSGGHICKAHHELTGPRSGTVRVYDAQSFALVDIVDTKTVLLSLY